MTWIHAITAFVVALALVGLAGGAGSFGRQPTLQLLEVVDIAPRDVELGDRLEILGQGFPAGKPARVTFRGALYRPGEKPIFGAEIVIAGDAVGSGQVEVGVGEPLQALFCRAGDRATHTTFEGEVEVAFAAASAGQPPVAGVLQGVILDIRPGASSAEAAREAEGQKLVLWLGLQVRPAPRETGLVIDHVEPGSRADAAGLAPGDLVFRMGAVRVASAGDMLPLAGETEVRVALRREGSAGELVRWLKVGGWRRSPPERLLGSAVVVLAALAMALLFGAPSPRAVDAIVQRMVNGLRADLVMSAREAGLRWQAVRALPVDAVWRIAPRFAPTALAELTVLAALTVLPFGQYLVGGKLDVALLLAFAAALQVALTFVTSGPAWRGLRAAMHVTWQHAPAVAAVASVVVVTGSLRLQEIARAQGGWPSEWLVFRSPSTLLAFAWLAASARIAPPRLDGLPPAPSDGGPPLSAAWQAAGTRSHRLIMAGSATALFLGGWSLPGLAPSEQEAQPLLEAIGAIVFLVKTATLSVALAWSERAMPRRALAEESRTTALAHVPLSLGALLVTIGWSRWSPVLATQKLLSDALLVLVVAGALAFVQRVRDGLAQVTSDGHLSPFL
ncbi:MAG: hypothetical protein ABSC94_14535 [Polyangiaceae bacterium]|jgi:NADH-quinone oxidoreductase subunit H